MLSPEILQIIAYRSIVAFKEALKRGELTTPSCVDIATKKYLAENDPIGEFCKSYLADEYHSTRIVATEFFNTFEKWCNSNCLSGLNITSKAFRKGIQAHKFVFADGVSAGIEDIFVYTPDYVAGNEYNPNIKWYDCSNCMWCGSEGSWCLRCRKREILENRGTGINVSELLEEFWNNYPHKEDLYSSISDFGIANNIDFDNL